MKTLTKWLFQPFDYIAGWPALFIGLVVMAILAIASYFTGVHFDGLLDTHINGQKSSLTYCIIEQVIPWFTFFILLYISGLIFSKTSIRIIDIAGTTAFARIPVIFQLPVTLCIKMLLPADLMDKLAQHQVPDFNPLNIGFILIISVFGIAALAWEVYLFYKAYSVSCNIKGTKAVISFIVVILIAEILSKVFLYLVHKQLI